MLNTFTKMYVTNLKHSAFTTSPPSCQKTGRWGGGTHDAKLHNCISDLSVTVCITTISTGTIRDSEDGMTRV